MPEAGVHEGFRDAPVADHEMLAIAELMQALSAPSRLRLLYALREGEKGVGDLADETGMTASAASQQLRVLRHLRFVATRRDGRSILYRLHDGHVAVLLAEARNHLDHAAHGWTEPSPSATTPTRTRTRTATA
jgi:ArsR family transcriptional regulator, nickel/cobalt-responsive transcriptional repressor